MAINPAPVYTNDGSEGFVPALWAERLLTELDPNLVWAGPLVSNHDYEGLITRVGDIVKVNSLVSPTVSAYNHSTGLTPEDLTTITQELPISQADSVAFLVADAERLQVAGAFESPAMRRATIELAKSMDTFVSGVVAAKATAKTLDLSSMTTPTPVELGDALLEHLFDNMLILDGHDIPATGRWAVVSPKAARYLVRSESVANVQAFGTDDRATANGVIARVAGLTIAKTTAMPSGIDIVTGHRDLVTVAHQLLDFRAMPIPSKRADQIDALSLYGAKVVRLPGLDTVSSGAFDETAKSPAILKTTVTFPTGF